MARSRRPYLIRAIYQWCCDDGQTPHLLVAADYAGCELPQQHVQDNRITLNVGMSAVAGLALDGDMITFSARFGGRPFSCVVPWGAVLAIFGRESGEGIVFGEVEAEDDSGSPADDDPPPDKPRKSHLRVVK